MPERHQRRGDTREDESLVAATGGGLGQRLPGAFLVKDLDQAGGRREPHVAVRAEVQGQVRESLHGSRAVQAGDLPHGELADADLPPCVGGHDGQGIGRLDGRQLIDDAGGGLHGDGG